MLRLAGRRLAQGVLASIAGVLVRGYTLCVRHILVLSGISWSTGSTACAPLMVELVVMVMVVLATCSR